MDENKRMRTWSNLTADEQLRLREASGHDLDRLPATRSFDGRIRRFPLWLAERNISFDKADPVSRH